MRAVEAAAHLEVLVKERLLRLYALARHGRRRSRSYTYRMPSLGSGLRLYGRAGTTDWFVYQQIFMANEYDHFDAGDNPAFIVDCGANVGYASAFFLARFPKAIGIALEPDADNFELLRRNLAPFGDRVTLVQAAVWSHRSGLCLVRDSALGEWGISVRECIDGETPDVMAMDMMDLVARAPAGEIGLLKVDIEGSETVVFGARPERWLDRVAMCIVELHDQRARDVFLAAMRKAEFSVAEHDNIAVARRRGGAS